MRIDFWTLALQAINVLVLVWLLQHFLFRPITRAIADRQAAADRLLDEARARREEADAAKAALAKEQAALAADRARVQTEATAAAAAEKARALQEAQAEAARIEAAAKAAIEVERHAMRQALEGEAAALAGDMATKLVARLPQQTVARAMGETLVQRIGELSDEDRRRLSSAGPLEIVSATPLDSNVRSDLVAGLEKALPLGTDLRFTADPALIGGCELRGPHVLVRNSWRADLQDMLHLVVKDESRG